MLVNIYKQNSGAFNVLINYSLHSNIFLFFFLSFTISKIVFSFRSFSFFVCFFTSKKSCKCVEYAKKELQQTNNACQAASWYLLCLVYIHFRWSGIWLQNFESIFTMLHTDLRFKQNKKKKKKTVLLTQSIYTINEFIFMNNIILWLQPHYNHIISS